MEINEISKDSYNRTDHTNGLMTPAQATRFLKIVWSKTPLLEKVRKVEMPVEDFTHLGIYPTGSGLSAVDADDEDISVNEKADEFYKINLKAFEYAMTRSIDLNFLDDNIEGKAFGFRVVEIMGKKASENIMEAGINSQVLSPLPTNGTTGAIYNINDTELTLTVDPATLNFPNDSRAGYLAYDTGSGFVYLTYTSIDSVTNKFTGVQQTLKPYNLTNSVTAKQSIPNTSTIVWVEHKLRKKQSGWLDILENGNPNSTNDTLANQVDGSGGLNLPVLRQSISIIDDSYITENYHWIMNKSVRDAFINSAIAEVGDNLKDRLYEGGKLKPLDFPILALEDKYFTSNKILFCDPMNLVLGYRTKVRLKKTEEGKEAINKNKRYYALRVRFALGVEIGEACSIINL